MRDSLKLFSLALLLLKLISLDAVAQKPELYVQTGHTSSIRTVAFSPDGKLLASCGEDGAIKLWDVTTGQELRSFVGHSGLIMGIAFSPDGKTLASGSSDETVKLWDVETGELRNTFAGHGMVTSLAFSPDGRMLASSGEYLIKIWDVATGRELRTLSTDKDEIAQTIAFSIDSKTLACGTWWKVIKLWDVSSGRLTQVLRGHTDLIRSVAFSPNGKTLASGSDDNSIRMWELSSGRNERILTDQASVWSVMFSPDGRTLASSGKDNAIKLWDVEEERLLRSYVGHSRGSMSVAVSPDGKMLASGSADNTIKLWDKTAGSTIRTLAGHAGISNAVAFSPDGKTLAVASSNAAIKLWDLTTGRTLRSFDVASGAITQVAYSSDGRIIAGVVWELKASSIFAKATIITLWEAETGRVIGKLSGHTRNISGIKFSPDGRMLASASEDNTVKLWDIATADILFTLTGASRQSKMINPKTTAVAFSPNGQLLAVGEGFTDRSEPAEIKIWDLRRKEPIRTLTGITFNVHTLAFSPEGKTLASGGNDNTIKLWSVDGGYELRTLEGHSHPVDSVVFSPDGKTLASGSWDTTVKLWDVSTGRSLKTLTAPTAWVQDVAFSPDGQTLVAGSSDAKTYLWEANSGKELVSLISIGKNDWAVAAPDGLFDGSPNAWRQMIWRFSTNLRDIAPVEAFFNDFYHPGLLPEVFSGKRPKAPQDIAQKDRRQPELRLSSEKSGGQISGREILLRLSVTEQARERGKEAGSGAQDVRLFRNGSLVKVWRGDVLQGKSSVMLETGVHLVAGENNFTAYAFNRDNIKSADATLTITGADSLKRKGVGYVLAVGVNAYANPEYNLKYAVADVQDFAEEFKRQQSKLNNYERVEVTSLNDKDATKADMLKALNELSLKVQPEDALVIFFAGHGTAQQNRFYLIPHDLATKDRAHNSTALHYRASSLTAFLTKSWKKRLKALMPDNSCW